MPVCHNPKYIGKKVLLEFAIGCGDTLPATSDWKRMGSMNTKSLSNEWDTDDTTTDDSPGTLRENIATYQTLTISGDGKHKVSGPGAADLTELNKHQLNPISTGGQPSVWLRMTYPDITITAYMLLTSWSREAPTDASVTYSMEATATSSNFGIIVEDTPNPDAVDVASVAVTPATASLTSGAPNQQLQVVVSPATAHQVVYFTSSNPDVATVTPQGLIRRVAAGSATITARAATDSSKTGACAVTAT